MRPAGHHARPIHAATAEVESAPSWKPAAVLCLACLAAAIALLPALFGARLPLNGLTAAAQAFCWVGTVAFGLLALVRFATQANHADEPLPEFIAPLSEFVMPLSEFVRGRRGVGRGNVVPITVAQARAAAARDAERPAEWSLDVIDRMEWKRFEDVCCAFYNEKGIKAATTRIGADGGVDIRLYQDDVDVARCTAIVQCKAWGQPVGVKTVRELRGVMAHEQIERAFFMAPNGFTDNAKEFAAANRITLLDGRLILAMFQRLPEASRRRLLKLATDGDWTTPTCPSCGAGMVPREGKRGPFWACSTYPRCRAKLGMRGVSPVRQVANG